MNSKEERVFCNSSTVLLASWTSDCRNARSCCSRANWAWSDAKVISSGVRVPWWLLWMSEILLWVNAFLEREDLACSMRDFRNAIRDFSSANHKGCDQLLYSNAAFCHSWMKKEYTEFASFNEREYSCVSLSFSSLGDVILKYERVANPNNKLKCSGWFHQIYLL